ncbi:MAG: SHD1 domain-containing protein, partial [Planctomycetota bacterium]
SQSGDVVTVWLRGLTDPTINVLKKERRRWTHQTLQKTGTYGHPSPSGDLIMTAKGVVTPNAGRLHQVPFTIPTTHDDFFLTLNVTDASNNQPAGFDWRIASASEATIYAEFRFSGQLRHDNFMTLPREQLPIDERFLCIPQQGILSVVLPTDESRLTLFKITEPLPGIESSAQDSQERKPKSNLIGEMRVWKDLSEKHSIQAKLLAVKQGYVKFEKEDGTELVLKIKALSADDQRLINNMAR